MIASWMLSAALWSVWMGAAAWMIERVLLRGRIPVRLVWAFAVALSIIGPVFSYAGSTASRTPTAPAVAGSARRPTTGATTVSAGGAPTKRLTVTTAAPPSAPIVYAPASFARTLPAVANYDRPLAAVWGGLSLALLVYIGGGLMHLHLLRRTWRAATIHGMAVMISEDTGPAVVGVFRGTIVLPERVLALEPDRCALMLRHEGEHLAAGDTRLLALAHIAAVVAPWNPVVWWQLRRLRLAVELDCDARVLRAAPDVGAYGRLLLDVGSPRRSLRFAGTGLSGHVTHLERRIRLMRPRATIGRRTALAGAICGGLIALGVGCALPAPAGSVGVARGRPAPDTVTVAPRAEASWAPSVAFVRRPTLDDRAAAVGESARAAEPPSEAAPTLVSAAPLQQQSTAPRITVAYENAPVANVLELLSEFSHRTILPSANVTGTITANVQNQPWDVALKAMMNANGYDVLVNRDSVIIVDTFDGVAARRAAGAETARASNERADSKVAVKVENVPLADVFVALGRASGRATIGSATVPGTMSAVLQHATWELLLTRIMGDHDYDVSFTAGAVTVPETTRDGRRGVAERVPSVDPGIAERPLTSWSWSDARSDSLAAKGIESGCSVRAGGDSATVTLLVGDDDAARAGHVDIESAPASARGLWVDYFGGEGGARSQVCGVMHGVVRLSGHRVLGGTRIVVSAATPAAFVVKTGSGRVLAGPVRILNEARAYSLDWSPVRR